MNSPRTGDTVDSPSLSAKDKLRILAIALTFLVFFVWSPVLTYPFDPVLELFVAVLILVVGGIVLGLSYRPYGKFLRESAQPVEEAAWTDYARLCKEYGIPVQDVWVVEGLRDREGYVELYGLISTNRHLFLDEAFFEEFDQRERTAALAREVALAKSHNRLLTKTITFLVLLAYFGFALGVIYLTGDSTPFPDWPLVPELLLIPLFLAGTWYVRRTVFRANRIAAERTDVDAVERVLETFAEAHDDEDENQQVDEKRLLSLLTREPSYRTQAERLRERFER